MNAHSGHIVIVEDDASVVHALKRLLNASGIHALSFASAEELIESGEAHSAACFVIDIGLPGLSGFELLDRLADAGIETPVIIITANDQPTVAERAKLSGAHGYFVKPFNGRRFIDSVREVCHVQPDE